MPFLYRRMYWSVTWDDLAAGSGRPMKGITTCGMDGSGLKVIVQDTYVYALAVDQHSASLYWAHKVYEEVVEGRPVSPQLKIYKSDLDGKKVKRVIVADYNHLLGLSVSGDWLYWWDTMNKSQIRLFSCNKKNANDLSLHEVQVAPSGTPDVDRLHLFLLHAHPPKPKGPCNDQLCSHICVPSPNGYMRCLCPPGFSLMSNGWSCGKSTALICCAFRLERGM